MLGVSGLIGNTTSGGDGGAAEAAQETGDQLGGSGGGRSGMIPAGFSEEDKVRMEEGERGGGGGGGNRWPRQETIALLKIRSDMDVVFRDASLKGPLWEQVSRKMAELGYHRSAKKCKEKFENVYKYHKRTKDGRSTKSDGKTYRFFDQLEALENIASPQLAPPPPRPQPPPLMPTTTTATMAATPISVAMPMQVGNNAAPNPQVTVSSTPTNVTQTSAPQNFSNLITASFPPSQMTQLPPPPPTTTATTTNVTNQPQNSTVVPSSQVNTMSTSFLSSSTFSSSSSTSSDEDIERRHKRKRKWKDFFEKVMKDVVEKQEELQKKFLETLEKRERDRMIREEAWRVQEMARINREHDLLVKERSMAAARESALISFLQKMSDQQSASIHPEPGSDPIATEAPRVQIPVQIPENPSPLPPQPAPPHQATPPPPPPAPAPALTPTPVPQPIRVVDNTPKSDNGGESYMGSATSSRWPKAEVQALINLRTGLDNKYQENGPKGPLWEEISAGMRKLGYNRNAKRCKEKWENINKYFKKVKESNKKRPEDSKTCPYFHQLEALYKEKNRSDPTYSSGVYTNPARPEDAMVPIMARPEQQWPLPQQIHHHQQQSAMEEHEGDNADQDDHHDDDDGDDDEEEDDEGSGYEIVTNKPSSVTSTN